MSYPIKIFYSEEDKGFIAIAPDLPGCSAFGETQEKALDEIKAAIQLWLDVAKEDGRPVPEPSGKIKYSGKILVRTMKTLHMALVERAGEEGVSLNQYIVSALSQAVVKKKSGC
jgi:antitoxin HicB